MKATQDPSCLDRLPAATRALQRRGPDDEGLFTHGRCGLGHRRLSILDPSPAGHQPMQDESGRWTIAFNGEVYNFKALRQELQALGHPFRTGTDTEVILAAWQAWGEDALKRFNGFFAFALYDRETETLVVARDRMGIKPLWWFSTPELVGFASEMKALYALGVPRELDPVSLHHYLELNYLPGDRGIYKAVQRLPAGALLRLTAEDLEQKQWWTLPEGPSPESGAVPTTYAEAQKQLEQRLDEAVQARLVSDVPLGAFLSGGIDSSVVVALASRHVEQLETFSIGYADNPFFDETRYAEAVAKQYGTKHTVFKLRNEDLYAQLHDTLDQFDQPFADSSALAVGILSRQTRKHVTVALSGDGADELFGGYHKHLGHVRVAAGGALPNLVGAGAPLWEALPKSRNTQMGNRVRQLARFAEGRALRPAERYWRWCGYAPEKEATRLLSEDLQEAWHQAQGEHQTRKNGLLGAFSQNGKEPLSPVLLSDQRMVLGGDMLVKVDQMSMAHSLEVRVPFLDHRVVAYANALPAEWKIGGGLKKRILQDAFRRHLPAELYKRPKQGFEVPMLDWFRGALKSEIQNKWLAPEFIRAQGVFDPASIRDLHRQLFSKNPGDVHARIWALIVFQHWWEKWHNA
jgi:asparagine synthase (glutamine-hydrolysing)